MVYKPKERNKFRNKVTMLKIDYLNKMSEEYENLSIQKIVNERRNMKHFSISKEEMITYFKFA